jgi:hypothetical protein
MPIARFEMPDGRIGRFEVPEGTTPDQATSLIEKYLSEQKQPEPKKPEPEPETGFIAGAKAGFQRLLGGECRRR